MLYAELYEKILDQCHPDYIYRQLAEECCELAQAALKVVRMVHDETPASKQVICAHYLEELADVYVMMELALLDLTDSERSTMLVIADGKRERWMNRLEEQQKDKQRKATETTSAEDASAEQHNDALIERAKQQICEWLEHKLFSQTDDGK